MSLLNLAFYLFFFLFCKGETAYSSLWIQSDNRAKDYVEDARTEDHDVGVPLELIPVPDVILRQRAFKDKIFDHKLTLEFQQRYKEQFGSTDVEVTYRDRSRLDYVQGPNGELISYRQNDERELAFGNYMFRRMGEYHFENISKTEENLRQVQAVKERVTNYEVSIAKGYGVKSNYSISGNFFDVNFINPYIGSRARLEMDPKQFGPGKVRETRIALNKDLTRSISMESNILIVDGIISVVTRKRLTPLSHVSLTGSTFVKSQGASIREHLGLLGYGLSF